MTLATGCLMMAKERNPGQGILSLYGTSTAKKLSRWKGRPCSSVVRGVRLLHVCAALTFSTLNFGPDRGALQFLVFRLSPLAFVMLMLENFFIVTQTLDPPIDCMQGHESVLVSEESSSEHVTGESSYQHTVTYHSCGNDWIVSALQSSRRVRGSGRLSSSWRCDDPLSLHDLQ